MMEDIVKFRDKTIRKNKVTIMNCKKKKLKLYLTMNEFLETDQTIKTRTRKKKQQILLTTIKIQKTQYLET